MTTEDKLKSSLVEIGLTRNESDVYLACLSLGATTALNISKLTGIKRTTVYSLIERLIQKGLIFIQTKGFKRYFAAENPERLQSVLDKRNQILSDVLPDLSSLYLKLDSKDSFIKHYRGIEGIRSSYIQLLEELSPKDYYLVISDQSKWYHMDPDFFEDYLKKRAKKKVYAKLLLQDSIHARDRKKVQHKYNLEIKILPKNNLLNTNLVIVPHKIVITQTIQPYLTIVVENPSIVQMNKVMFDLIWDTIHN